jgi:hypothetical protein
VAITVIARRANEKDANYVYSTTWKHIFLDAMDDILNEKYEAEISYSLGMKYGEILLRKVYTASLPSDQIRTIRIQLEALGLIKAIATTRQSDGETRLGTSWVITDKGRRYMVENLALKTDPTHSP